MTDFDNMSREQMQDRIGKDGFSLKHRIRCAVMTEPSKPWPTYDGLNLDRTEYVTASEASRCVRQLAFGKNKTKNTVEIPDFWEQMSAENFEAHLLGMGDDDMRGIFARGNTIEDWIVKMLEATAGDSEEFLCLGADQRSFYTNKHKVSGTPDGIWIDMEAMEYRVLEFKSTQNPVTSPREGHLTQLQVNMGLIKMLAESGLLDEAFDMPFSSMTLVGGNILYVHTDNYLGMMEKEVPYDGGEAYMKAQAKARALYVKRDGKVQLRRPDEVEAEGLESWNGCMFCEHKGACADIEERKQNAATTGKLREMMARVKVDAPKPVMPTFKADAPKSKVAELLLEFDAAREEEKAATRKKDALKEAIKSWVSMQEGRTASFGEDGIVFSVNLTETNRSGGLDQKKLAEALEEYELSLDSFKKPDTKFDTLNVKVKTTSRDV